MPSSNFKINKKTGEHTWTITKGYCEGDVYKTGRVGKSKFFFLKLNGRTIRKDFRSHKEAQGRARTLAYGYSN